MGARELSELLDRASAEVAPPAFAEAAWSRAHHVRRRRRAVVAVASVVAAVVVTGAAVHSLRPGPPVAPAVTAAGTPAVDRIPPDPVARPLRELPATGLTPPDDARNLTVRPVRRAVAVYERYSAEESARPQPLYVLDTDGTWARIDQIEPTFTRDSGGNLADPLRPTAISPDRLRVAVAQPDGLVIVDVTGGSAQTVPLPGFNEQVVWLSDDVLLVTQDRPGGDGTASFAVDRRSAKVSPVADDGPSAWNAAGPAGSDGSVVELRGRRGGEPVTVTVWDIAAEEARRTPVDPSALGNYRIDDWYGPVFHNGGDLVVRSAFAGTPTLGGADVMAVVDVRTGVVRRLLEPGGDRMKGCCEPLAWVDDHTVLLRTDREGLLAWDVRSGEVTTVAAGAINATIAVALD